MERPTFRGRSIDEWFVSFDERLKSLKEGQDWDRKLILAILAGVLVVIGLAVNAQAAG
ncbi:hypothetical protein LCGC14_2274460 [marine sediment metagenome]|uniref:Uncharacterized protein n=1 Tax=marine sediment metagenome TaxID=412755 RepID=A0A0F9DI84_9ZZZZ